MSSEHRTHAGGALTHVTVVRECVRARAPTAVYSKLPFVSVLFNLFRTFSASWQTLPQGSNYYSKSKAPNTRLWRPARSKCILRKNNNMC